jgi:predicted small metal-binding protein
VLDLNTLYGKGMNVLQLECKDLGMDCDYVVTGKTVEEVAQKAMVHAQRVHADVLKTMSTPAQMAEMEKLVVSKIR